MTETVNQLAEANDALPGIGHNQPPLSERIADALRPAAEAAEKALAVAGTVRILDDESAQKVIDLIAQMRNVHRLIGEVQADLSQPYRSALDEIDAACRPLLNRLSDSFGATGKDGLRGAVKAYGDAKIRAAEEAKRKAEAEAAAKQAEADRIAAEAAEKAEAGDLTTSEKLVALKATEDADAAARRARAITPEPVRAQLGTLGQRRVVKSELTDLRKFLGWCIRGQNTLKAPLTDWSKQQLDRIGRQLGVNTVERQPPQIDGARIWVENESQVR